MADQPLSRIRRLSKPLAVLAYLGAVLALVTIALMIFAQPNAPDSMFNVDMTGEFASQLGARATILSFIPATLLGGYLCLVAGRLFSQFARGAIFTAGNSRLLKRFAQGNVLLVVTTSLVQTAWLLVWGASSGTTIELSVGVSTDFLAQLGLAMTFLLISWVFDEALRQSSDYELIF